jgi:hypothetical protein
MRGFLPSIHGIGFWYLMPSTGMDGMLLACADPHLRSPADHISVTAPCPSMYYLLLMWLDIVSTMGISDMGRFMVLWAQKDVVPFKHFIIYWCRFMDNVHAFVGNLMGGSVLDNVVFNIKGYWKAGIFQNFVFLQLKKQLEPCFPISHVFCVMWQFSFS